LGHLGNDEWEDIRRPPDDTEKAKVAAERAQEKATWYKEEATQMDKERRKVEVDLPLEKIMPD